MEEILDQDFKEKENDETKINRATSIARYIFSAYYLYILFSTSKSLVYAEWRAGEFASAIGGILGIGLFLLYVYYNIKHANIEIKNKYVYPVFNRYSIIMFLFWSILLMLAFVVSIFSYIILPIFDGTFTFVFIETIVLTVILSIALSLIIYREFIYLKRTDGIKVN